MMMLSRALGGRKQGLLPRSCKGLKKVQGTRACVRACVHVCVCVCRSALSVHRQRDTETQRHTRHYHAFFLQHFRQKRGVNVAGGLYLLSSSSPEACARAACEALYSYSERCDAHSPCTPLYPQTLE